MSDDQNRRKALEEFAKQLSEGLPFAEDFLDLPDRDVANNALLARNLTEDTLAHQVMKNTGVPVPDNNASFGKKEDFLRQMFEKQYPELKQNLDIVDLPHYGDYGQGQVRLSKQMVQNKPLEVSLGKLFHEGAHGYDEQKLGAKSSELDLKNLRNAQKSGVDVKNLDPLQAYDIYAKNHHAKIPGLRDADNFGEGALKSFMKSGTFKQVAGALPVVGGLAAATMSGDASAAVPLLDEADDVGESRDEEATLMGESKGFNDYQKSQARMDALKKMGGR